jgi:hypothetical protein
VEPKDKTEFDSESPFRRPGCTCDGAQAQQRFDFRKRLRQALIVSVALTLPIITPVLVWAAHRRSAQVAVECPQAAKPTCRMYMRAAGQPGTVTLWHEVDWGDDAAIISGVWPKDARDMTTSLGCELVP